MNDEFVPDLAAFRDVERDRVVVDGDPMHYLHASEAGPPVILLHGGIIDAAHISWPPQFEPIADEARLIVPNLAGYGPNPLPDEPLSIPRHVEYLAGFLDALSVEDAVVAGVSLGGGVAVGLGLERPDIVRSVVALDAMGLGSDLASGRLTWLLAKLRVTNHLSVRLMRHSRRYVEAGLAALAHDDYAVPADLVDLVQTEARRPGAGAAFRSLRATEVMRSGYRTDYGDRLDDLGVPVRFFHGDDDETFPVAWSERAAQRAPGGSLSVLEDCGHLATWERPDAVAHMVLDSI